MTFQMRCCGINFVRGEDYARHRTEVHIQPHPASPAPEQVPAPELLADTKISTCLKCAQDTATLDGDCVECGLSKTSDLGPDQNGASSSVVRNDSDVDQPAKAREWWIDELDGTACRLNRDRWGFNGHPHGAIPVIERSALTRLEGELAEAREDRDSWERAYETVCDREMRIEKERDALQVEVDRMQAQIQFTSAERAKLEAKCEGLSEQAEALAGALREARNDERERIIDDAGNPGLEGCGSVSISTKYDDVLAAFEKFKKGEGK